MVAQKTSPSVIGNKGTASGRCSVDKTICITFFLLPCLAPGILSFTATTARSSPQSRADRVGWEAIQSAIGAQDRSQVTQFADMFPYPGRVCAVVHVFFFFFFFFGTSSSSISFLALLLYFIPSFRLLGQLPPSVCATWIPGVSAIIHN